MGVGRSSVLGPKSWVLLAAILVSIVAARTIGAQSAQKTVRDKVYSKDQAARGEKQYAGLCANCHDPAKPPPAGKKAGPPLVGEKFLTNWDGRTLGELLTTTATTMPNDGSAVLSDEDTADVIAYLLQANGFPDGPAALKMGATSQDVVIVKK
ncbi:MAG: c-type cytochrome [Vicinamibacterales bacterium]